MFVLGVQDIKEIKRRVAGMVMSGKPRRKKGRGQLPLGALQIQCAYILNFFSLVLCNCPGVCGEVLNQRTRGNLGVRREKGAIKRQERRPAGTNHDTGAYYWRRGFNAFNAVH